MIPVAVMGAAGRMGRRVVAQVLDAPDLQLVAAIGRPGPSVGVDAGLLAGREPAGVPVTTLADGLGASAVVVDFSLPAGTSSLLDLLEGRALVSGTTGFDATGLDAIAARARVAPVLHAANFSTGVAMLLALARIAASSLPDWDVEIVEAHHRMKHDAPSGTALAVGRAVAEARGVSLDEVREDGRSGVTGPRAPGAIGLHALRIGGIVGQHELWIGSPDEHLILGHTAGSRDVFAAGAVRAARWIAGREPGAYGMSDVLGLGPR